MLVKVYNDNVHPYQEKFRDELIKIPAGEFIEMDADEAHYLLSQFSYPVKDGQNVPDPKFFKMLRIVALDKLEVEADPLMNHATGVPAESLAELNSILSKFSDRLLKDEDAEKYVKKQDKQLRKENDDLRARLEKLEQAMGLTTSA